MIRKKHEHISNPYTQTRLSVAWSRHANLKTTVLGIAPKCSAINGEMHHQTLMAL